MCQDEPHQHTRTCSCLRPDARRGRMCSKLHAHRSTPTWAHHDSTTQKHAYSASDTSACRLLSRYVRCVRSPIEGLAVGRPVEAVLSHSDQLMVGQAFHVWCNLCDPALDVLNAAALGGAGLIHQIPGCITEVTSGQLESQEAECQAEQPWPSLGRSSAASLPLRAALVGIVKWCCRSAGRAT